MSLQWNIATFSGEKRMMFYEQLGFLLDSNTKFGDCLHQMREVEMGDRQKTTQTSQLLDELLAAIAGYGGTVETVLQTWLPDDEAALISAGYLSGQLTVSLHHARNNVLNKNRIFSARLGAILYPLVLGAVAITMLCVIAFRLVPELEKTVAPERWTGSLWFLSVLSGLVTHWGLLIGLVLIVFWGGIFLSLPRLTGPWRLFLEHLPPWSSYRSMNGAIFLLNVAALQSANIPTMETIKILRRFSNPWLTERLNAIIFQIDQGAYLGKALKNCGMNFPSKACANQLYILTKNSGYEDILNRYAQRWLDLTVKQVERSSKIILLVSMGMMFSFDLLLFSAISQIQSLIN